MKNILLIFLSLFILFNLSFADSSSSIETAKKEKIPINITSDKLIAQENIGLYTFIGNVVAKRKDATLYANKMDVYKDLKTGDISKIVCIGNVVITQPNKLAKANEAIYELKDQKITLIGNAYVKSGKNVIKSDMIVYYLDKKYAVAQGSKNERVDVTIYPNENQTSNQTKETK